MSNTTERKDKEDYFTVFVKKFEVFMQKMRICTLQDHINSGW